MSTRIALFCDKLLEAGWLAALIVAPLFFNVYSSRVFEPDKISLVRSIALVMVAAWIVKQIETGLPRQPLAQTIRALPRDNPLILPTLAVVVVYLVATIFSVAPTVSLWGSYQRLQGTDTTLSYIAIFLITASSLRTRPQLDRILNTAIVVSFPIAFYGILQHYQLDPLPWGGDTTLRVASNMGNSIFVAAYLIMIVPLTVARWIETLARIVNGMEARRRVASVAAAGLGLIALAALWAADFVLGTALALALFLLIFLFALFTRTSWRDVLLALTYTVILAAQLVTILFSQSRGPQLGLGAGLFAFVVLGVLAAMRYMARRWRLIALTGIVASAALAIAFLVVFNLPSSPLESLKSVPYIGRLGQILDRNSPTAQVRELIWQGAVELISPHEPLWSPTTGDDPVNLIRPLVGYGPEAMYVAFNPFYPPELGRLEARNASPDRSHNETLDSLVMTGLLGFGAYILLFISIFYFGLKWLGVIDSTRGRNAFLALWLAGGAVFGLGFSLANGWNWIGVALPFGMIAGFLIFLIAEAVRRFRSEAGPRDMSQALWLSALVGALLAHFAEIHFGIAIVSTRTYFWVYAALLVVLGTSPPSPALRAPPSPSPVGAGSPRPYRDGGEVRRKRRRAVENARTSARKANGGESIPLGPVFTWTAVTTVILLTMAFEFMNNQAGVPSALDAVARSLFYKGDSQSFGIFLLFLLTWVIAGIVGFGEELKSVRVPRDALAMAVALFTVLSLTALVWYILFQMRWLTQPGDLTNAFINVLGLYYVALFLLVGAIALALAWKELPAGARFLRAPANAAVAPVLAIAVAALIFLTNYSGVAADILYKSGSNLDNAGAWDRSQETYQRALEMQPNQDFYSLFLGRAYLEGARTATDPAQRARLLNRAEQVLLQAQRLNPLNTDHSANLARLHRIWATLVDDPAQKTLHYAKSSEYYQAAIRLSPNTAYLYNEWSQTYLQAGDLEKMRATLEQSVRVDARFAQTYLYLGEYYRATKDYARAADNYFKALELDSTALAEPDGSPVAAALTVLTRPEIAPRAIVALRAASEANPAAVAPHYALSDLYKRNGQMDLARQELELVVKNAPGDYYARLTLVNFYSETGQIDAAVTAMRGVMDLLSPTRTPDFQRFQDFYTQLQNLQRAIQNAQKAPNDVGAHRTLAAMWKARGQAQFALPEYQTVARLAPSDYDAHRNLVLLNLQLNQPDDAQRALTAITPLAPDNEKPLWQNLQMALNSHKAQQLDQALKQAQAALALAAEADKPAVQAYVTLLQEQVK
ncbi:MAG: O-antigen ligase family protein [Chloroflexi bacterium]|nr:O-antigen ligase family protein [Chloroflexota bacterium]